MYEETFKDLNQVKGIVRLIKNMEILHAFIEINEERLIPLFMPKAKVKRYEKGNFCSECNYKFYGKESDYHYCVSCGTELACCDDDLCDKDRERAEESMMSFLKHR